VLRVNHCGTGARAAAVTSMTFSHLVDGRNQASSPAAIGSLSVMLTYSQVSTHDTRQTNCIVIQTIFFISFTQNTYAVIFLQNVCAMFAKYNIVANAVGVSFNLINIIFSFLFKFGIKI
jgi:hypothetical protein